jgi:hypothetical protein
MSKLTKIVAAVVDTNKATLYRDDGTTIIIHQGDVRLRPILEEITPLLGTQGYAMIDLNTENYWKQFEEKSTGGFRLFKIAKDKLKNLFGSGNESVPTMVAGVLPSLDQQNQMAAVNEVMAHAKPVRADDFEDSRVAPQRPVVEAHGRTPNDSRPNEGRDDHYDKHEETIVAVAPNGNIVPGLERIKSQFAAAAKSGSVKGLEVFLTRLSNVIQKRKHTVEDLLRFMERGDLPVADDGTIIIYKKLQRQQGHYVDVHSKKVRQKVGSYVHMDESLVDPNRRNECSNGLHVARRGYIPTFGGDVIVLAKVRPEDVIAVPDYDANKMRVCGYHIVAELTPPQFQAINSNRPISEAVGGAELLGNIIAGNHIDIIENVKICAAQGGDLQVTPVEQVALTEDELNDGQEAPVKPAAQSKRQRKAIIRRKKKAIKKKAKSIKPVTPLEAVTGKTDTPVDIKAVAARKKDANVSLAKDQPTKLLSQQDVVQALWQAAITGNKAKAQELLDFKKKAKKGWATWGLDASAGDTLKALIGD